MRASGYMKRISYIHGTHDEEQERLTLLNRLTNPPFLKFLALRETDRVLEVGSGLGLLASEAAQLVPQIETNFIFLAQAFEGLHRVRLNKLAIPEKDFQRGVEARGFEHGRAQLEREAAHALTRAPQQADALVQVGLRRRTGRALRRLQPHADGR